MRQWQCVTDRHRQGSRQHTTVLHVSRVIGAFSRNWVEEKVSCKPLIQSEIDSSVTPISALFS